LLARSPEPAADSSSELVTGRSNRVVRIDVETVGYHSALVGAVLLLTTAGPAGHAAKVRLNGAARLT
jgi:hypothetical protein